MNEQLPTEAEIDDMLAQARLEPFKGPVIIECPDELMVRMKKMAANPPTRKMDSWNGVEFK